MGRTLEYPKDVRNTVVRKGKDRGHYDLNTIHTIINSALVVHCAFPPSPEEPFPAILPMIGVMASFSSPSAGLDEPLDCYLHGYVSSRIMNVTRVNPEKGLPVSISAAKVDGLVLALTPNAHSYNYRSAVVFGYAELVTDAEEKLWAMEQITNKVVYGRWEGSRIPPNKGEMASTQILRVKIENGSGKIRDGPPADDKCDTEDEDVLNKVWSGYVPVLETMGEPVPSAYNRVEEVPEHVKAHVKAFNEQGKAYVEKMVKVVKETNKAYGEV
jgi:nitroimidazol reductase NimA-like FMN-containing flavoprotein (pyridoxamine 5'-phosphate oxidase superfamily)